MFRSLWIAKTGLNAQQTQLDAISHNLANVSTTGFKRSHAQFEDLLYQNIRQAGGQTTQQTTLPTGLQLGTGVRPVATSRIFTQGGLQESGNPLDMAISGNGFFPLALPDGSTGLHPRWVVQGGWAGAGCERKRLSDLAPDGGAGRHRKDNGR